MKATSDSRSTLLSWTMCNDSSRGSAPNVSMLSLLSTDPSIRRVRSCRSDEMVSNTRECRKQRGWYEQLMKLGSRVTLVRTHYPSNVLKIGYETERLGDVRHVIVFSDSGLLSGLIHSPVRASECGLVSGLCILDLFCMSRFRHSKTLVGVPRLRTRRHSSGCDASVLNKLTHWC